MLILELGALDSPFRLIIDEQMVQLGNLEIGQALPRDQFFDKIARRNLLLGQVSVFAILNTVI